MKQSRYSLPAIVLHWLQAALVLYLLWLGLTMVDLPKGAERSAAYGLHKSLGLLVLALTALRLAWRRVCPPPPAVATGTEARLVKYAHLALYGFLLLAPLAGYLASAFTTYSVRFFGLELPRIVAPDEGLNAAFRQLHVLLVWAGAGLIAAHLAGVVRHLLQRDGTLSRMLPWRIGP